MAPSAAATKASPKAATKTAAKPSKGRSARLAAPSSRRHNEGHGRRLTAAFEALEAFPDEVVDDLGLDLAVELPAQPVDDVVEIAVDPGGEERRTGSVCVAAGRVHR